MLANSLAKFLGDGVRRRLRSCSGLKGVGQMQLPQHGALLFLRCLHAAEGKVKATVERQPLESINAVFERLKHGKENGRIVLDVAEATRRDVAVGVAAG